MRRVSPTLQHCRAICIRPLSLLHHWADMQQRSWLVGQSRASKGTLIIPEWRRRPGRPDRRPVSSVWRRASAAEQLEDDCQENPFLLERPT